MPIDLFEATGAQANGPVDLFAANGIAAKPSLTLGQRFNEALTLPESFTKQSTLTKIRELPSAMLDVAMQGVNAMYSMPAKVIRRATAAPFVGTERAEQLANELQQQLTVKPLTPGGEAAMQVLSSPFTVLNSYLDEAGSPGYLGKVGLETVLSALPIKQLTKPSPAPRQAPFTEKNLMARQMAEKYDLPAYPKTLSNKPALQGVVNAFQDKVVPLFEQTHNVVRDLVETVKEGYKTVDEQGSFLGTKGDKYDAVIAQLPETFEMPKLKEWMGKQVTKLKDLQTKRALKQSETDLLAFYERMQEQGGFAPQSISEINGKNPMTGNQKVAAKWRMYEDLKTVPNGEEVSAMLKETNTEYGITTKSRIMTNFLDKVMSEEGRINPSRWTQLYNNFKLQNIAKMKDAFGPLDEVDKIVKSFSKELQDYNRYFKNPTPGGLEKTLTGIASLTGAGGLGGAYFGVPSALPLTLSGLALGTKYLGGKVAKGAAKSGKLKMRGEEPFAGFKDHIYDRGMEYGDYPGTWGNQMDFDTPKNSVGMPVEPSRITKPLKNERGSIGDDVTKTTPDAKPKGGIEDKKEYLRKKGFSTVDEFSTQKILELYAEDPISWPFANGSKREIGKTYTFWRKGEPPESGYSHNFVTNKNEKGVSAYLYPEATSIAGIDSRPWYKVRGELLGYGSDGEPIIRVHKSEIAKTSEVRKAIDNKHLLDLQNGDIVHIPHPDYSTYSTAYVVTGKNANGYDISSYFRGTIDKDMGPNYLPFDQPNVKIYPNPNPSRSPGQGAQPIKKPLLQLKSKKGGRNAT